MLCANRCLVACVLLVYAGLLAWLAARHSPTIHEMAHLPAGICHWQYGMFELYRVNPPLPRMVAALPVLFCHPQTDWGNYQLDPLSRETIPMGVRFAKANGARTLFLFMVARWACIPFCVLGAWVCYRWACELWGIRSGLFALCLWCFNPMILGHGAVVMPDVPAAALGVFAAWRFWKWLRTPAWLTAALAGLALGAAELCKTTLLVFFILWPVAWVIGQAFQPDARQAGKPDLRRRSVWQLMAVLVLAVYVINLGYAFKGTFQRLGDFRFQSRALSGQPPADLTKPGNRFAETWLGRLPVPLPRDYLQGIDCQRNDFEVGGRSYLHGRWEPHGWWYYYFVGLGIKTPLGTLAALFLAASMTGAEFVGVRATGNSSVGNALSGVPRMEDGLPSPSSEKRDGLGRPSSFDELLLLLPAVAILALVSSQTGFSAHVRYAIPAFPYLFIWCGKLLAEPCLCRERPPWRSVCGPAALGWRRAERHRGHAIQTTLACLCLVATIVESLSVYPHSLSFFNLFIGGPRHGHEWLLDSNGAWGQDLVYLKELVGRHPEARPLRLANVGWLDPRSLGIDYTLPPVGPSRPVTDDDRLRVASGTRERAGSTAMSALTPSRALRDNSGLPQTWDDVRSLDDLGPRPGWYAVDVNFLHGTGWSANWPGWRFQKIADEGLNYEYFRHIEPCDYAGYSYLIYHVTRDQADRVRRKLGLSLLPSQRR